MSHIKDSIQDDQVFKDKELLETGHAVHNTFTEGCADCFRERKLLRAHALVNRQDYRGRNALDNYQQGDNS